MTLATVTVDLARTRTQRSLWHVVALPSRDVTLCSWAIPDGALRENDVDAHVISLKGRDVCSRCRRALRDNGPPRRPKPHIVDAEVVCTVCLADLLERLVGQANTRYAQERGSELAGPMSVLADESGVPVRTIRAVLNHERATTGLRIADALLCAFDRPDLLHSLLVFERSRNGAYVGITGSHVCHKFALAASDGGSIEPSADGSPLGEGAPVTTATGELADEPNAQRRAA